MINFLYWLYSTIPFIQLFNNRFNILGLFWFIALTGLTLLCLKKNKFDFGAKTKKVHYFGLVSVSIFIVWVFYRMLDELLTIFTVVSWDPSLLNLNPEALFFWLGKGLSFSILLIGLYYLFNYLKIKIFKFGILPWIILVLVAGIQRWSVHIFKVDYAVLTGLERITVFWTFYPILYISYAVLYFSTIKLTIKSKVLLNG